MGAPINLNIHDLSSLDLKTDIPSLILQVNSEELTVAEIIAERVKNEINNSKKVNVMIFTPITFESKKDTGDQLKTDDAILYAQECFKLGEYFLFLNDKQVESLTEKITITEKTQVKFIKLVALQGG